MGAITPPNPLWITGFYRLSRSKNPFNLSFMGLFKAKSAREVVVYSMGRDGSAAVQDSLSVSPHISTRQVYTLDRSKIANMNMRDGPVPAHIAQSEKILRENMASDVPHHFITMVHDPFRRHIRQCFYLLQHRADEGGIGYALSHPQAMQAHFESVPSTQTTHWFQDEFIPATGLDVFATPFDHDKGYQEFKLGIHRLLLLSAHIGPERQTDIIGDFLGTRIAPILPEKSPMDGLRDVFMAQILSSMRDRVISDFWYTRYSQHFFSTAQISAFQAQGDDITHQAIAMQETIEALKNATTRDRLLQDALSPIMQVPQLTAELSILAGKRGNNTIASVTDSLLKQMQRAQNNLLLSAIRAVGASDPRLATELGDRWMPNINDDRITRALATTAQQASGILKPLALLDALPARDERQEVQYQRLAAQKRLLEAPFSFSPRSTPVDQANPKTILYNPHQALPFHTSGYATRTQGLTKALRDLGYDIQLVARAGYPADTRIPHQDLSSYDCEGVPYRFDTSTGQGQWDLPMDAYIESAVQYLVAQAQAIKPAILHTASNYLCGVAGIEAARRLGIPSIYEMRGLWHITYWSKDEAYADTDKFALAQKMELECAAAADHVLAITGALRDWLIDHGIPGHKITIAPNAVDVTQFQIREKDIAFADMTQCTGKIVIGYIGSFVQYEGLDLLVKAVSMLPDRMRAQIKLLWLGDGPVLHDLLEQAADLNVADTITALGRRPFDEVPRAYSIVDIAVFPRKGQAICEIVSPLKPFEAMAMGKAVIASDVRPLKDIIAHGETGLLHRKDDAADLADKLARMIEDKDLRDNLGSAARAWVEGTRRWDQIAQNVEKIYGEIR